MISKKSFDKMKNMIELQQILEPLLLKDLQRDSPPNHELFWYIKMKNENFGKT